MKKRAKKRIAGAAELRRRAEERLERAPPQEARAPTDGEGQRLVHELLVHQTELEMQNEELRSARLDLETALARYTELFDFAPIGYVTLDERGKIVEINHAATRLTGQERWRIVGLRLAAFVSPQHVGIFNGLLERALQTEETSESCEIELRRGDELLQLHVSATGVRRTTPMVLLALQDITERRLAEARSARAERELREADRKKDEFMAVLSHELRNPLAPIRNSLYVVGRVEPGSAAARRAHEVIERQVTHLTRLVDDLLDVTRIVRGKIRLQRASLEVGGLVRRIVEDHRSSFEASGLRLETYLDEEALWIDGDPARITQVIGNLLGNAEKFTPRGGTVTVSMRGSDGHVDLRVTDTGCGIDSGMLKQLFEPFAQAPQTMDRSRGGLGLGLAMVKGLVELHGGSVSLKSEGAGRGTTVAVVLPRRPAPQAAVDAPEQPPVRSRRVLIIEDSPDTASSLRDALELGGHLVEVAADGRSGIELARTTRPEIVLCDIGLPGMDGYDVARAFRADEMLREAHLVALTGYASPDDIDRAVAAGFDQHVSKPPMLETLDRIIGQAPDLPERDSEAAAQSP